MTAIASVRRLIGRVTGPAPRLSRSSSDYRILTSPHELEAGDGWHDDEVAQKQDQAFSAILRDMHLGQPRIDLVSAAQAVRLTGLANPSILEVGCGSGYYSEALAHLLNRPVNYTGIDYSPAMVRLAQSRYPAHPFEVGDATQLHFDDNAFDIVLSGGCLMHIADYPAAIRETARVAKSWCIFHTVPVLTHRATTFLQKKAYGRPALEVIINRGELLTLFASAGLALRHELDNIEYDLSRVLGEPTPVRTFVCEVNA